MDSDNPAAKPQSVPYFKNCMSRLFLLDMLLGNADRLPCATLGWRGNPHNVLFCTAGAHAGRMVAIDSAVQRRPPGDPEILR